MSRTHRPATPACEPSEPDALGPRIAPHLRLHEGDCWVFFAFDAGYAIDLDAAQKLLAAEPPRAGEAARREEFPRTRRSPSYLQFRPAPLRIDQPAPEAAGLDLGGFRPAGNVECTLYDFGAVSVAYRIPLVGGASPGRGGESSLPLAGLVPLAQCLFDCSALRDDATRRATELMHRLAPAIDRAELSPLVEDYTVYHARRWSAGVEPGRVPAGDAITADRHAVAALLLAEPGADGLSSQSVESALSARLSYSEGDAAVIDWNAALILGRDEEDSLAVLEFANIQLFEMRLLDDRLDAVLDRSFSSLLRRDARGRLPRSPLGLIFDPHRAERRRLAALQMESAVLFEGVNNALKLVGDQHLARLYTAATKPFHWADWDRSIMRKLHTAGEKKKELAGRHDSRYRFWTGLLERAKQRTKLHANISPGTSGWVGASGCRSGLAFNYVILKKGARIELYIDVDTDSGEGNKKLFRRLEEQKAAIEADFGGAMEWDPLEGARACRISAAVDIAGWKDETNWPAAQDAMIDTMIRFEKALRPRLDIFEP